MTLDNSNKLKHVLRNNNLIKKKNSEFVFIICSFYYKHQKYEINIGKSNIHNNYYYILHVDVDHYL